MLCLVIGNGHEVLNNYFVSVFPEIGVKNEDEETI